MRSEAAKHRHAVAQVLTWLAIALIWSVTAVQVLGRLGVPVASLVAPAAVLGAALGFGAQQVGAGPDRRVLHHRRAPVRLRRRGPHLGRRLHRWATGTIEEVALRTTRLRRSDGAVVVVSNGPIVQTTNLSREWARAVVDVPLPAGTDMLQANELLRRVGAEAFEDEELRPLLLKKPTVMGAESLEVGQVNLRVVARTLPGKQFKVAREPRVRVAVAFQREGIGTSADAGAEPDPGGA